MPFGRAGPSPDFAGGDFTVVSLEGEIFTFGVGALAGAGSTVAESRGGAARVAATAGTLASARRAASGFSSATGGASSSGTAAKRVSGADGFVAFADERVNAARKR